MIWLILKAPRSKNPKLGQTLKWITSQFPFRYIPNWQWRFCESSSRGLSICHDDSNEFFLLKWLRLRGTHPWTSRTRFSNSPLHFKVSPNFGFFGLGALRINHGTLEPRFSDSSWLNWMSFTQFTLKIGFLENIRFFVIKRKIRKKWNQFFFWSDKSAYQP